MVGFGSVVISLFSILLSFFVSLNLSLPTNSQSEITDQSNNTISQIIIKSDNGSVLPKAARSETITVTPTSINKLVTKGYSYDPSYEVVEDKTVNLSEKDFAKIVEYVNSLEINANESRKSEGCTGGSTTSLKIDGDVVNIDGYVYSCAGEMYGTLSKDPLLIKEFVEKYM